ncbi:hypothetical protein V1527DRAFT_476427 [Lipomyces starkeyi]
MLRYASTLSIFTLIFFLFETMQTAAVDIGLHPGYACAGYGVQKCRNQAELQCCYTSRNFRGAYFSNGVGIGDIGLSYKSQSPAYCGRQKARTTMTRTTCLKSNINWRGGAAWFNCFSCIGGGGNPHKMTKRSDNGTHYYGNITIPACKSSSRPIVHENEYMFAWIYGHDVPTDYTGSHRNVMSAELTDEMNELLNDGATEEEMEEKYSEYFYTKDDAYYRWLGDD